MRGWKSDRSGSLQGRRAVIAVAAAATTLLASGGAAHACTGATMAALGAAAAACCPTDMVAAGMPASLTTPAPADAAPPASAAGGSIVAQVQVRDFAFLPAAVTIPAGATVQWTHAGLFPHTVTSATPGTPFDSGTLGSGGQFSHTFAAAGDVAYECIFHFGMEGTVDVRLPGDANDDNAVNIADFSILAANFNTGGASYDSGDFNLNGTVEIGDFSILAANFNTVAGDASASGRPSAVPEPAAAALGALAALAGCRRRARSRR